MPRKKKAAQAAPLVQQIKQAVQQLVQQAKQQAKAQQVKQQVKVQQAKTASKKRAKADGVTDAMRERAALLVAAIKSGRLAAKQGVTKPAEAQGKTARDRYVKFIAMHKKARVSSASTPKAKAKSVKTIYQQVRGPGSLPYYLASGYTSRVGGGASGPGVIRAVPGSGALPFRRLDEDEQRQIVSYLNSGFGSVLRGPGAKKKVNFQEIMKVLDPKKAQARAKAQAAAKAKAQAQAAAKAQAQAAAKAQAQAAAKAKRAQAAKRAAQTRRLKKSA